jgi:hypothetical protein
MGCLMAQWIAFDEAGVRALAGRTSAEVELGVGDTLTVALDGAAASMVLLPDEAGRVTVLTIRVPAVEQAQHTNPAIATGFLGLVDTSEVEEPPAAKKSWLRKLFRP